MPFSDKSWSQFTEADYPTAGDYCSACLIDENPSGEEKTKARCKLPVKEPNGGPYNRNGIHAAAGALAGARGGVKASAESKRKAARRLIRLYREMDEVAPEAVYRIAGKRRPKD